MFQYVLAFFLNWGIEAATAPVVNDPVYLDLAEGVYFKDLSSGTIELLNAVKHQDKDMRHYDGMATNTDDCFTFSSKCQPDYTHHIFYIPMQDHKGHYYTVTFSFNYKILSITNSYSHS